MYEHLLVALDGSEAAERVLVHAEALANAFHSTVMLLRAVVDVTPPLDPTPILDAERSGAGEYLAGVAAGLRQKGITVSVELPEGDAADMIVERARALGVSLIAMTTHGRGGLGRLVFGSTADSVLRHATCPVLLVRVHET
jgi:nucleotide-binding universal stress UspA family protein